MRNKTFTFGKVTGEQRCRTRIAEFTLSFFCVTGTHFRFGLTSYITTVARISGNEPTYADISALFNSKPMSTDKAVASATALAEAAAVRRRHACTGSEVSIIDGSSFRPTGLLTSNSKITNEFLSIVRSAPTQIFSVTVRSSQIIILNVALDYIPVQLQTRY
jgi:hypothetical protein